MRGKIKLNARVILGLYHDFVTDYQQTFLLPEGLMKKRIVITTEKREVWILRWPSSDRERPDPANQQNESEDSLAPMSDQYSGTDILPDEREYRSNKGVQK